MSVTGPVHFIAHFTINDPDRYRRYEEGFLDILSAHGGRFVTYDDHPTVLGGERVDGRTVILRFETEDACLAWWSSPEYLELARIREAATTSHSATVVHSLPRVAAGRAGTGNDRTSDADDTLRGGSTET